MRIATAVSSESTAFRLEFPGLEVLDDIDLSKVA